MLERVVSGSRSLGTLLGRAPRHSIGDDDSSELLAKDTLSP
ncbi:MAG: hypothetical protein WCF44_13870 [Candidatus Methylophosphatis roskildensis]